MTLLEMTSRYEELVAKENLTESENREYISLRIELTKIQEELGFIADIKRRVGQEDSFSASASEEISKTLNAGQSMKR